MAEAGSKILKFAIKSSDTLDGFHINTPHLAPGRKERR